MDTANKVFVTIGAIALVATAGVGGYLLFATRDTTSATSNNSVSSQSQVSSNTTPTTSTGTSTSTNTNTSSTATTASSSYKDGVYTASTNYSVPHGESNSLSATIVVSGGKITDVKVSNNYTDRESGMYIDSFNSSVNSDASGQSLANYSPSRIGGASLTTWAFSDVISTIRSQATA